jgi:hypothetical protein
VKPAVSSVMSTMPNRGTHHGGEKRCHAYYCQSCRGSLEMWQNGLTENGEEPSELGSQNKHRGKEAAGSACRVRQGPQKVANGEEQREQGRALQPGECALRDCVTTSDKPWSSTAQLVQPALTDLRYPDRNVRSTRSLRSARTRCAPTLYQWAAPEMAKGSYGVPLASLPRK